MRLRQPDAHRDPIREPGGPDEGNEQAALRARGAELLSAADAAISRALSQDSRQYLAQNRQSGGQ
jgi:hypothetical protein